MGDSALEAISGLYEVTGVHSKVAHAAFLNHVVSHLKTLISIEFLNTFMIHFLLIEAMDT
jgi:hypothetical protein